MRTVLIGALLFLAGCTGPIEGIEGSRSDVPCMDHPFTVLPVDLDRLESITPLGNLNPPEHTLPTVHMYLHPQERMDVMAPGDIILHDIQTTTYHAQNREDHGLRFSVCEEVHGYFLHLKSLDPALASRLDADCDHESQTDDGTYSYCGRAVHIEVEAGTVLGQVEPNSFDLGLRDDRVTLGFANPDRYTGDWVNTVCPLDYFVPDLQESLRAALDHPDASCGAVMQDVPGTLAGAWFHGDDANAEFPEYWTDQLAFVVDNRDPDRRIISIGGVFMDAARWQFTPASSGTVNPYFADVHVGETACYQGEADPHWPGSNGPEGRIVVELVDRDTLHIEHQTGQCDGDTVLQSPTEYRR